MKKFLKKKINKKKINIIIAYKKNKNKEKKTMNIIIIKKGINNILLK